MALPDIEVYRAASALIKAHGDRALTETLNRADLAEKTRDPESGALRRRIGTPFARSRGGRSVPQTRR